MWYESNFHFVTISVEEEHMSELFERHIPHCLMPGYSLKAKTYNALADVLLLISLLVHTSCLLKCILAYTCWKNSLQIQIFYLNQGLHWFWSYRSCSLCVNKIVFETSPFDIIKRTSYHYTAVERKIRPAKPVTQANFNNKSSKQNVYVSFWKVQDGSKYSNIVVDRL
jgi:hypothetical protein